MNLPKLNDRDKGLLLLAGLCVIVVGLVLIVVAIFARSVLAAVIGGVGTIGGIGSNAVGRLTGANATPDPPPPNA